VLLIEHDDGSSTVDERALAHRLKELDALIKKRKQIERTIVRYRRAVRKLIRTLGAAMSRISGALEQAGGKSRRKERAGYRSAINTYLARIQELKGVAGDLGLDVEDQRIDLTELRGERKEVARTKGVAAEAADTGTDLGGDLAGAPDFGTDTGAVDTGGVDTGTPADTTTAPPTAADIAAGVIQELTTFTQGRRDLLSQFGGTGIAARQAFTGAGPFSGHPDELTGAAALRAFGATGTSLGGFAGKSVVINNTYLQPPDNAATWTQQMRWQVEAAA
jgi:hypothetical protein